MSKSIQWVCIMCMIILPSIILAQEWVARYNGPGNGDDRSNAIALDNTGNIYVTGTSYASGTYGDYATVKYDSLGVQQWVVRYNGPGNGYDEANAIALDNAGNIYVTGRSYCSGYDNRDYATVKYNSSGVEQWVTRYDGPVSSRDEATAIAVDNTGSVYITGQSCGIDNFYDYATVKYDSSGVGQWVARYNGPGNLDDCATAIALDNAGNIYVTGWSLENSGDYATVKYDPMGVEQWVARYDGPGNHYDAAYAIAVDCMSNVYVTGSSYAWGIEVDYATVKYDSLGVELWVVRYNGPGNGYDEATAIALDDAGNVYVTGYSDGSGTSEDYATVKYDSLGIEQWVARYNAGNEYDAANAIALDNTGNIYVTGTSYASGTYGDYATVKYDSLGVQQWVVRYNGPGNGYDEANAIALDNAGNIYVTGWSFGPGAGMDYVTIKYLPTGIEEQKVISVKNNYIGATVFRGSLQLPEGKKCKVFDITGRVVEPDKITPGIYFVEIDNRIIKKVVKVR